MEPTINLTQIQSYINSVEGKPVNNNTVPMKFSKSDLFILTAFACFVFAYAHYNEKVKGANYPLLFGFIFSALSYLSTENKKYCGNTSKDHLSHFSGECFGVTHALIEAAMTVENNNSDDKLSKFNRFQYYLLKLELLSMDERDNFLKNPLDRSYLEENTRHWLGNDPKNHGNRNEKLIKISNEISIFFNQVNKYQHSQKESEYLRLMSHNLLVDGGAREALVISGVYNEIEIGVLFNKIKAVFVDFQHPLAMHLHNVRHSIAVVYYEQNFHLIDTNNERIPKRVDVENLPHSIIMSLSKNIGQTSDDICIFSTTIYCTGKNSADFKQKIDILQDSTCFKTIHAVTPKKATISTDNGLPWLMVAIDNKETNVIEELLRVRFNHQHFLNKFILARKKIEPDLMIPITYHMLSNEKLALLRALGLFKIKLIEWYHLMGDEDATFLDSTIQMPADAEFEHITGLQLPKFLNIYQPLHDLMIIICIECYINRSWIKSTNIPYNIEKMLHILDETDSNKIIKKIFDFSRNVLSNKSPNLLFLPGNTLTKQEREFFHMIVDNESQYIKNHQCVSENTDHTPAFTYRSV